MTGQNAIGNCFHCCYTKHALTRALLLENSLGAANETVSGGRVQVKEALVT